MLPPSVSKTLRACWSPPYRRCSITCSDRGATPSSSVASLTRSSTPETSALVSRSVILTSVTGLPSCRSSGRPGHGRRVPAGRQLVSAVRTRPAYRAAPGGAGWDELVADVADRADQRLVLRAKLGTEPAHMDVDRPRAAEVVISPHLLQQLGPGEHVPRVLGEELQQLELLECQVECHATDPRRVRRLVDDQLARPDLVSPLGLPRR